MPSIGHTFGVFFTISVVQHYKFRKATSFIIAFASDEKKCIYLAYYLI